MPLTGMARKGYEGKFGYGMMSRSHNEAEGFQVSSVDPFRQSCWANMPPELLRDVLMRIEVSESTWQRRKSVVACAGVCRSWREVMKEIVGTLQVSGKVTFPISLKQPGPRSSLVQCFIKRLHGMQTYHLYLNLSQASNDQGKFLLAARRCRRPAYTDYIISLKGDEVSKGSSNYIGKLRSNFLGTKFTIYDAQPPNGAAKLTSTRSSRMVGTRQVSPRVPAGNYPVAHISYELNVLGSRGPRRMHCVMDAIAASAVKPEGAAPTQTELVVTNLEDPFPSLPFFRPKPTRADNLDCVTWLTDGEEALVLKNKAPRWHDELQCWCLNFNGRVTVASVKNFQLVAATKNVGGGGEEENVILQFGKVGKDTFTMDYQYPLSAFQAFALCLSSFDTKIACE